MQAGSNEPSETRDATPPPASLGGCELGEQIRSAGALRVYAGRSKLGLPVELHVVAASALGAGFDAEDFLAAVRASARARHESLATFTDGGRSEGDLLYAVARSAEGRTVDELLGRGGALATERALSIAAAVAHALAALADAGTRHGDLTPRRVTLPGRGAVLVQPPRLIPPDVAPRRARYQSPEEARGEPGDIRSDLFVLGLLLVEMLTARSPVPGSGDAARSALAAGELPAVAELLAGYPAPLARAAAGLLAERREDRFSTPRAAAAVLEALAAGEIPDASQFPEERPETAPVLTLPADPAAPTRSTERVPARKPRSGAQPAARRAAPAVRAPRAADTGDRAPGRLFLAARLGTTRLEIEEDLHVGWPEGDFDVRAAAEPFEGASFRVERRERADVLVALVDGVTVGGNAVREHVLKAGDALTAPRIAGRYERGKRTALRATPVEEESVPDHTAMRRIVVGAIALLFVAVFGFTATRARDIVHRGAAADTVRQEASGALAAARRDAAESIDGPATGPGPERAARTAYEAARSLSRSRPDQPEVARQALERVAADHPDTAWGALARTEALGLGRRERSVRSESLDRVIAEAEALAAEGGLVDALRSLRRLADERPGTVDEAVLRRAVVRLDGEIQARVDADEAAARAALGQRDFQGALAALRRALDIAPFDRKEPLTRLQSEIMQVMTGVAGTAGGGTTDGEAERPPPVRPPPDVTPPIGPPPRNGGAADADGGSGGATAEESAAERDAEALKLFKDSRRAMDGNDHVEALQGFLRFLRDFADTPSGVKYDLETRRRITSLATGDAGVVGLFRGKVEKRNRGRWRITYDFEDPDQMLDFRDVRAFQATPRAEWSHVSGGARAKGSGAFMLDAKFSPEFLSIRLRIDAERPHDLGPIIFEHERTDRFYLYTIQNSWFTLGGGEDAPVFRENAIILLGPDMWADTPPGEIGFVRKAGSDEPEVKQGESIEVKAGKSDAEVWFRFPGGRTIRGSAYGDKKVEFDGLSPGVFVLNSAGFFDDVVIEGIPDPDWVAARWRAILSEL